MSSINYNGSVVNNAVSELKSIINEISSLSGSVRTATNKIVSSRGFNEYIGGISSDSFSSVVSECGGFVSELVNSIREKQINILAYSEDKDSINLFLDELSNDEFNSLDLSSLDNYISIDRKAGNLFKGVGSSIATFGLGLVEGVMDFGETGADLITLGGSLFASIFTGGYDLITGSDTTKKMWEETKAKVSEKKVESIFNNFYSDNPIGQSIKENAYFFDGVRGIGKGLGYSAGVIGTSLLTGGLTSGLGVGAAGSVGAGNLAVTAGVMGFSNGTEEAWADGATTGKGLLYGIASGAWEGTQWALGAKINQVGGLGDQVSKGIFKGATSGVGTRIALDTVDSAAEGFVQPALTMIYKDYGADNIFDNYANAFESMGGWSNVLVQGAIGGIGSAVGELSGARKILKSSDKLDAESRVGAGSIDDKYEIMSRQGATHKTIDGLPVTRRNGDNAFNSNILKKGDRSLFYIKGDGSFLPLDGVDVRAYDRVLSYNEINSEIYANRHNLSSANFTRLKKANDIFHSVGVPATINELKLIASYSNGNVTRIESLLSKYGVNDGVRKKLAETLSRDLFLSGVSDSTAYRVNAMNAIIDKYRAAKGDESWDGFGTIFSKMKQDNILRRVSNSSYRRSSIENFFGKGYISESTVDKLVKCDGLPSSIKKILSTDNNIPRDMVDKLSNMAAYKVFLDDFSLYSSAIDSFSSGRFSNTFKWIGADDSDIFGGYAKLFKVVNEIDESLSSNVYYSLYDRLVNDYGLSSEDACKKASMLFNSVLHESGYTDRYITFPNGMSGRRSFLLNFDGSVFRGLTNERDFNSYGSNYMRKYLSNGSYDLDALSRDFRIFAAQSCSTGSDNLSLSAKKLFFDSYFSGASDSKNKNAAEVYRVMAKLLELRDQGKAVEIGCDGVNGSSCRSNKGIINFGLPTIKSNNSGTVFHESGHLLFGGVLNEKLPSNFTSLRDGVMQRLRSASGREQVEILTDNCSEIVKYVSAVTDNSFDRMARQKGYSGADGFREAMIKKYTDMIKNGGDVESQLSSVIKNGSSRPLSSVEIKDSVDLSNATECADFHIKMLKSRIRDNLMRVDFEDYSTISGMLDSVSQGDILINYGHGAEYFNKHPERKNLSSYHELVADYTKLKLSGNNHTIKYLRKLFGDEFVDQLDATYNEMLK